MSFSSRSIKCCKEEVVIKMKIEDYWKTIIDEDFLFCQSEIYYKWIIFDVDDDAYFLWKKSKMMHWNGISLEFFDGCFETMAIVIVVFFKKLNFKREHLMQFNGYHCLKQADDEM